MLFCKPCRLYNGSAEHGTSVIANYSRLVAVAADRTVFDQSGSGDTIIAPVQSNGCAFGWRHLVTEAFNMLSFAATDSEPPPVCLPVATTALLHSCCW